LSNTIQSLRPNVTRAEAEAAFGPRDLRGLLASIRLGKLRSIAATFIPFQVFKVKIQNGRKTDERILGIDAVNGMLDLYAFAGEPEDVEWVETRSNLPVHLSGEQLTPVLKTKVQRVLFQTGFFKLRDLQLQVVPLRILHIPYWVALYGAEDNLQMRVMDAVRRQIEGAKVRRMIHEWLQL
jgi:hypothetical protein